MSRTDLTAARLAPQPADYSIDPKGKQVRVKFGKKLNAAAIGSYASRLAADPSFRPDFSETVDLRDVEVVDLQAEDFLELADKIDPFSPEAKRAFVVQTVTQQHAARLHQILRSKRNIAIFGTIEEAENWIGS